MGEGGTGVGVGADPVLEGAPCGGAVLVGGAEEGVDGGVNGFLVFLGDLDAGGVEDVLEVAEVAGHGCVSVLSVTSVIIA